MSSRQRYTTYIVFDPRIPSTNETQTPSQVEVPVPTIPKLTEEPTITEEGFDRNEWFEYLQTTANK